MKKATMAVALALVFGLFTAAFSLAPVVAQDYASDTTTSSSNATMPFPDTLNVTGTDNQTFSASGRIAAIIYDISNETDTANTSSSANMTASTDSSTLSANSTMSQTITGSDDTFGTDSNMTFGNTSVTWPTSDLTSGLNETTTAQEEDELEPPYIVAGDWSLDVQDGNVSDFRANFTMVQADGTGRHTHNISNFEANGSAIELHEDGVTFIFGTSDVMTNGSSGWTDVATLIVIENSNAVSITLSTDDNHFKVQPLYGVVDSLTDEDGNELIQSTETAEQVGTNVTDTLGGVANQTGDFLSNLTEGFQNLTGLGQ